MNRKRILLGINLLIFTMMILVFGRKMTVHAKAVFGELQVELTDLKTSQSERKDVEVRIYRVGTVTDEGVPQLDARYALGEYPKDNDSLEKTAKKLAGMVMDEPVKVGETDENGNVRFEEIEPGVYLVIVPEKNHYGKITPFLVPVPYCPEVDGVLQEPEYVVKAEPKASPEDEQPEDGGKTEKPDPVPDSDAAPKPGQGENGGLAKTGDKANVGIWLLAAVISLSCVTLIIKYRRKHL